MVICCDCESQIYLVYLWTSIYEAGHSRDPKNDSLRKKGKRISGMVF